MADLTTTAVEVAPATVASGDIKADGSGPQVAGFKSWAEGNGVAVPVSLPGRPDDWFDVKFPGLRERYGPAVLLGVPPKKKDDEEVVPFVKDLGEDFLAATLGVLGTPSAPTVFVGPEGRFYTYNPDSGIYEELREAKLLAGLSASLLECARDCGKECDTTNLEFRFRDTSHLRGVAQRARGLLEVPTSYFESSLQEYIACHNGMLRLADREVLPFSASYRRRNKLTVDYVRGAECPMFLDALMRPALEPEELDLLQRWCGLALIGVNHAQRMVVLTGTSRGGKGTFVRVLRGIIGGENMATLRPMLLGERFELGRFLGKSLLYGPDVPEDFLNCKGASYLKAMIGGDPMTMEFKGSNERPEIVCRFNAIVTCNSRLTVRLEGDAEAWRRRLGGKEPARAAGVTGPTGDSGHKTQLYLAFRQHRGSCSREPVRFLRRYI
jgi:hypothetical protein